MNTPTTMNSIDFYRKQEELLDISPGTLTGREPLSSLEARASLVDDPAGLLSETE
jgi:hypothetical protein